MKAANNRADWWPVLLLVFLCPFLLATAVSSADGNYFQAGLDALRQCRYDEAIRHFSVTIETIPDDYEALNNRGIAWFFKGEYRQAVADYSQAIAVRGDFLDAYNNRGAAWFYLGEYQQAIEDCSRVIAIRHDDFESYTYRGTARYYLGDYSGAIADCKSAVRINPDYDVAHDRLALILSICPDPAFRDPAAAVRLARRAVSIRPEAGYLDTLATALFSAGDQAGAAEVQKKALAALPPDSEKRKHYAERLAQYRRETASSPAAARKPPQPAPVTPITEAAPATETAPIAKTTPPPPATEVGARPAVEGHPKHFPYLVQIGSYRQRDMAMKVALTYSAKGEPVFTSPAVVENKGLWHRVFYGYYSSRQTAASALEKLRLRKFRSPYVSRLPYAVQVVGGASTADAMEVQEALIAAGHVPYRMPPPENRLLVGAFFSDALAGSVAADLRRRGFDTLVVRR